MTIAATMTLALAPVACGGGRALDDPLAPVPIDVDPRDVAPPPMRVEWRVQVRVPDPATGDEGPRIATAPPGIDHRFAYVAYGDVLQARGVAEGELEWSARFSEPITLAPLATAHGVVVASGAMWSWVDAAGAIVAIHPIPRPPRDAVSVGAALLVIDEQRAYRIDVGSTPDGVTATQTWATPLSDPVALLPGVGGDRAYVTTSAGAVIAIDSATGAVAWRRAETSSIPRRVAVDEDSVYVADRDGAVRALRTRDGRGRWTSNALGVAISGAPAVLDDVVWVVGLDAGLHGFAVGNGSALHRVPLASRSYVDLATVRPWVLASPLYGPWTFVRAPTRPAGPQNPGAPATQVIRAERGISLAPAIGPAGIVLVDDVGYVQLVRPEPREAMPQQRPRPDR